MNIEQKQQDIRKYFESGGRLTVQQAFYKFSTTELRKIVSRLRKIGLKIADCWRESEGVRFKEYFLDIKK